MRTLMAERKILVNAPMFRAWLKRMGWNDSEAAKKLGASRNSIAMWKQHGAPFYIGIAAAALEQGRGQALNIRSPNDVRTLKDMSPLSEVFNVAAE